MDHIDLSSQGEAVKAFFRSVTIGAEGAVLVLNGQVLARLVHIEGTHNGHTDEEEWTDDRNDRRCELIDRKYEGGLTTTEEAELAALQTAMYRHIDRVAPLPIAETRKLHQQLLRKAIKLQARGKQ